MLDPRRRRDTRQEIDEKLADYFAAGVQLVLYIDPVIRSARPFTTVGDFQPLREDQALDGGAVLRGFVLPRRELFTEPLANQGPSGPQG